MLVQSRSNDDPAGRYRYGWALVADWCSAADVSHCLVRRWPERSGPVAVPIDRWGHMPFPPGPMTPAAIGSVIDAHGTGIPLRHLRHAYRTTSRQVDKISSSNPTA